MSAKTRKAAPTRTAKPKKALKPKPATAATLTALTPGAVLRKTDREGKVRCECTVEAGGFSYQGELFNSLSGAASAAAKDLKLSGTSFNGYVFWGLKPSGRNPLHRVEHLWQRYSNAAAQLLKADGPEKTAALERLRQHVAQIKAIAG
jgi:hypothetical protein